jgi:hypothetical protein
MQKMQPGEAYFRRVTAAYPHVPQQFAVPMEMWASSRNIVPNAPVLSPSNYGGHL